VVVLSHGGREEFEKLCKDILSRRSLMASLIGIIGTAAGTEVVVEAVAAGEAVALTVASVSEGDSTSALAGGGASPRARFVGGPLSEAGVVVLAHCLSSIDESQRLMPDIRAMMQTIRETDIVTALVAMGGRSPALPGKLACNALKQLAELLAPPTHSITYQEAAQGQKFSQDVVGALRRDLSSDTSPARASPSAASPPGFALPSLPWLDVAGIGRLMNLTGDLLDNHPPCREACILQGLLPPLLELPPPFKAMVVGELLPSVLTYCQEHKERLREVAATAPTEVANNIRFVLKYAVSPAGVAARA